MQTELFSKVAPPWPLQVGGVVFHTILPWWIRLRDIRTLYSVLFPLPYRNFCSLVRMLFLKCEDIRRRQCPVIISNITLIVFLSKSQIFLAFSFLGILITFFSGGLGPRCSSTVLFVSFPSSSGVSVIFYTVVLTKCPRIIVQPRQKIWSMLFSYRNLGNYGVLGLWDWLHGTDQAFKRSVKSKRDKVLWTLKSAHELWPDPDVKKMLWVMSSDEMLG